MKGSCVFLFAALAATAQASTLYKCTDRAGHTTYTTSHSQGTCVVLSRDQPAVTTPAPGARPARAATPSPAGFPRVSEDTQKSRDTDRRRILEQELASETRGLEESRSALAEQEAQRVPASRLQSYRDQISLHERNLTALRREIGNLR
ncbi:MAG: DUF4124 domain-containing protein [Proteobacteria bacterium]|nr:DUF4124 domain-containing protein [Pseudomonadota bacterium]HQR03865.1 DUF4124 domain-containing protein [Rhodocyclaceae bacterium]